MVIKVTVPHQFKLKVIPDLKTLFFMDRKDIHYIGRWDNICLHLWKGSGETTAISELGTGKR